jgi:hypothetical protein
MQKTIIEMIDIDRIVSRFKEISALDISGERWTESPRRHQSQW